MPGGMDGSLEAGNSIEPEQETTGENTRPSEIDESGEAQVSLDRATFDAEAEIQVSENLTVQASEDLEQEVMDALEAAVEIDSISLSSGSEQNRASWFESNQVTVADSVADLTESMQGAEDGSTSASSQTGERQELLNSLPPTQSEDQLGDIDDLLGDLSENPSEDGGQAAPIAGVSGLRTRDPMQDTQEAPPDSAEGALQQEYVEIGSQAVDDSAEETNAEGGDVLEEAAVPTLGVDSAEDDQTASSTTLRGGTSPLGSGQQMDVEPGSADPAESMESEDRVDETADVRPVVNEREELVSVESFISDSSTLDSAIPFEGTLAQFLKLQAQYPEHEMPVPEYDQTNRVEAVEATEALIENYQETLAVLESDLQQLRALLEEYQAASGGNQSSDVFMLHMPVRAADGTYQLIEMPLPLSSANIQTQIPVLQAAIIQIQTQLEILD